MSLKFDLRFQNLFSLSLGTFGGIGLTDWEFLRGGRLIRWEVDISGDFAAIDVFVEDCEGFLERHGVICSE